MTSYKQKSREKLEDNADNIYLHKCYEYVFDKSLHLSIFSSFLLIFIYFLFLQHSIMAGESVEVVISSCNLADTLSYDNSLTIWINKLAILIIPWGSPAYKTNILVAILNSFSAFFMQITVLRLTKCYGSSLMAISLFFISKTQWILSTYFQISVVTNFLISGLISLSVLYEQSFFESTFRNICKIFWMICLFSFLLIFHDYSSFIYSATIMAWIFIKFYNNGIKFSRLVKYSLSAFLISLIPFLIFSTFKSPFTTLYDVNLYEIFRWKQNTPLLIIAKNYMDHMQLEFCELSPWLFLIGIVTSISWLFISRNVCCFIFILMFIFNFLWSYIFIDLSKLMDNKEKIERFIGQCDCVTAIITCLGFHTAIRMVTEKFLGIAKLPMSSIFTMMGALILFVLQLKNYQACKNSANNVVSDYGLSALKLLPEDSIVLTFGQLSSNSLRYLQTCEDIRTDLKIIDINLMLHENSLSHLKHKYQSVSFPGRFYVNVANTSQIPNGFNIRKFIGSNIKKSQIFICTGLKLADVSHMSKYKLVPFGVCRRVDRKKKKVPTAALR